VGEDRRRGILGKCYGRAKTGVKAVWGFRTCRTSDSGVDICQNVWVNA